MQSHSGPPKPFDDSLDLPQAQIQARDAHDLLLLMARVATLQADPRVCFVEALAGLCEILPASAAAAMVLHQFSPDAAPQVFTLFEFGFKADTRAAFLQEFNLAPFHDRFSQRFFAEFHRKKKNILTCLRADLIDDDAWSADPHVQTYRSPADIDDCIFSLHRGGEPASAYAILLFCSPTSAARPSSRFTARERTLADLFHRGLAALYRAQESNHQVSPASGLPPRLRQTLELLLANQTERQIALQMSLSVHTVHEYVKTIYARFAVSKRSELVAKWIQIGGQLPPPDKF